MTEGTNPVNLGAILKDMGCPTGEHEDTQTKDISKDDSPSTGDKKSSTHPIAND
jgi:hypothetical protein